MSRLRVSISRQPSAYPPVPFHLLRLAQLLSSLIVATFLFYFIGHLLEENYKIPWTFILLSAVSTLTPLALVATTILHQCRTLPTRLSLLINAGLSTLWCLGLALLLWNVSGTLARRCTLANWSSEAGVMVCRMYKALATFAITGTVSTILALLLDIRTQRKVRRLGTYDPMGEDETLASVHASKRPFGKEFRDGDDAKPLRMKEDRQPEGDELHVGEYKIQQPIRAQHFGYSAPAEQTNYAGYEDGEGL